MKAIMVFITLLICMDVLACKVLPDQGDLDVVSDAYIGRVYQVMIPKLKSDIFEKDIQTSLMLSLLDKVLDFNVYKTIKGKALKTIKATITGCSSNLFNVSSYGVLYKIKGRWVFSPDDQLFVK